MKTRIRMSPILVIYLSSAIFIICNRPCSGQLDNEHPIQNSSAPNLSNQEQEEDFQPYTGNKGHPIYSPILSAHLDEDPNEELNSLHGRKEEDPLLEETEEDDSSDITPLPSHITEQSSQEGGSPVQNEQVTDQQYTSPPEVSTTSSVDNEPIEELSTPIPDQPEVFSSDTPTDDPLNEQTTDVASETEQTFEQTTTHPETQPVEAPTEQPPNQPFESSAQPTLEEAQEDAIQQLLEEPIDIPNEVQPELPVAQPTESSTQPDPEQAEDGSVLMPPLTHQPLEQVPTDIPEKDNQQLRANLTSIDESSAKDTEDKSEHLMTYDLTPSQEGDNLMSSDLYSEQPEVNKWSMHFQMDSTILIYTLFCIAFVSIFNLGKWLLISPPNADSTPAQASRSSLENLKDMKSLQNLQNQADRLRLLNQKLADRIKLEKRLEPIKDEIASLKEQLGSDVKTKIIDRKVYLKSLKKLVQLKNERNELESKVYRFKHGQLAMIMNFIELDNLMDLLKDIEFQKLCNNLRESIFRRQVEIEFLDEQVVLLKRVAKQFQTQYKEFSDELLEERKREKIFEDDLAELKLLQKDLDEGDSIDTWKSKVDEKITEVDKLYLDYYYNYRYINELLQGA